MQISPINQNMNNNNTSFKKLIVNDNRMAPIVLDEIARSSEVKELAKYLHNKKGADLLINIGRRFGSEYPYAVIPTLDMYEKIDKNATKIFSTDITKNTSDVLEFFNAKKCIAKLEGKIEYTKQYLESLRENAIEMIEAFNRSLEK